MNKIKITRSGFRPGFQCCSLTFGKSSPSVHSNTLSTGVFLCPAGRFFTLYPISVSFFLLMFIYFFWGVSLRFTSLHPPLTPQIPPKPPTPLPPPSSLLSPSLSSIFLFLSFIHPAPQRWPPSLRPTPVHSRLIPIYLTATRELGFSIPHPCNTERKITHHRLGIGGGPNLAIDIYF